MQNGCSFLFQRGASFSYASVPQLAERLFCTLWLHVFQILVCCLSLLLPSTSKSSVMGISVFSQQNRGLFWAFPHDDCLILCWVSSQTIFLVPYVYTSEIIVDGFFNFRGLFVGIKYLCVICI